MQPVDLQTLGYEFPRKIYDQEPSAVIGRQALSIVHEELAAKPGQRKNTSASFDATGIAKKLIDSSCINLIPYSISS
ncbi:hypothetical protein PGRAT_22470 [Paenibacillus graminis]|uniref:Uncharacterized protein n=1 Tax=Paenibacillus graminis TaxID=189425 RepID=A0A089MA18_9BACL|nr:hypothetical protein PGRAT_22470 [Paenibacillus graminis]